MKLLVLLVLLGVSTILVSCQDAATESPGTSDAAAPTSAAAETSNTESETEAGSTDEVTDAAPEETETAAATEETETAAAPAETEAPAATEKPKESIIDKGKTVISKIIEKVKKDIPFLG